MKLLTVLICIVIIGVISICILSEDAIAKYEEDDCR